jgi:hypothetical protein
MARRRTMTSMTDLQREQFIRAAIAFHKACTGPMSTMRTTAPDYAVLRDVSMSLSAALGELTGDPTPWYRGFTSPSQ